MASIASPRDRRNVTILFVDIVGSTSLIEKSDAELVHSLFAPAINAISSEVVRFSGHVSKVMGDGLMAIFGVPYTLEDHAKRAAYAALAIQVRIGEYGREVKEKHGLELQVRVGLNSGSVVVSVAGDGDNELFDALGSPVHLASRVESQTPPGGIGVSKHTYELTSQDFEFQKLGSFNLKGFSGPEVIYSLLRVREFKTKQPLPGAWTTVAPMIGREAQQRQLLEATTGLARGHGSIVLVSGEAGSGKTRFVAECKNVLEGELLWLEGRSSSYDQRVSYWPFIEFLQAWFNLSGHDGGERNWSLLVSRLNNLFGAEADEVIPYVATLMGMEVRDPYAQRVKFLDTDQLSRQILRAMRRLFERMAIEKPVVLVIDDFHWADDSSVGLVEHLLGLCLEAGILICVTTRSESGQSARVSQAAQMIPGLEITVVELPPLQIEQSINLLEQLIGKEAQTKYLRDRILYKAGGNPFFIEEVVRSLIGSGALIPGRLIGTWTLIAKEVSVPDTIHDVVMARVDRLDTRLKSLLYIASVIGQQFLYTILKAIAEHDKSVDEELNELGQRQFIEKSAELPELIYMFKHGLVQESVYESLLQDRRKDLHIKVAECLLEIFAGRTQAIASVLAFHYARADQSEKTLQYLLEAAEQSSKIAADAEALKYYEEALDTYAKGTAAPWEAWQKATIESRLGEIHFHRGNLDVAEIHFLRALEACGDPFPKTRFGLVVGLVRQALIQIGHRIRPAQRAPFVTKPDRLQEIQLLIYEPFIWLLFMLDNEKFVYAILKSLNFAERLYWGEGLVKCGSAVGNVLDMIGLHRMAQPYHVLALERAESIDNPSAMGITVNLFGLHDAFRGRWDQAMERFSIAEELCDQTGNLICWCSCCVFRSHILIERGAFAEVLAIGSEMVRRGQEAAFDTALRWGLAFVGTALWRLGELNQSQQKLEDSLRRSIAVGDHIEATHSGGELGLCLYAAGKIDLAAEQLEQAALVMHRHKVLSFSTIPIFLGLAQIELSRLDSNRSRSGARAAMKRCRAALAIARRFRFGLVWALRMMGTLHWLNGRQPQAEQLWQESLQVALQVGARYEAALTHIEIGKRLGSSEEEALGEQMLAECRAGIDVYIDKPG